MKKEQIKTVDKAWGEEIVFVNNDKYCAKFLIVKEGAQSSYHYHIKKEETFFILEGIIKMIINGEEHILMPHTRPRTIEMGDKHSFTALQPSVIMEVSTTHDDSDVVRLEESKCSKTKGAL